MISFRCPSCGQKLNVRDHYAGRQAKCPACKQPLVVPPPSQTAAPVAAGAIGTPSSLGRAGVEGGLTLDHGPSAPRGNQQPVRDILAGSAKHGERYVVECEIARGGMGAVLRAVDCDIHREVAVKYLLDQDDPRKKLRFVEEAQITGQLEHPNIVPTHEMGVDGQQRLFFAMKMVKGRSLAQVLDELREQPKTAQKEWPLGRLLTILVNVCHALAYAHARGVIHRDLKPANIMVGDFGEVYVMDWGLAKVLASGGQRRMQNEDCRVQNADPADHSAIANLHSAIPVRPPLASKVVTNREGEADLTQDGAILGTPAYMPPEQACGDLQAVDQRSDVYSLGAILYEMLTLEPPVERDGGYLVVLVRVMEGDILPPEQPTPQRCLDEARAQVTALENQLHEDGGAATRRQQAARARAATERQERLERALRQREQLAALRQQQQRDKGIKYDPNELRVSTTDPEARRMKMPDGGTRPGFNVQLATTTDSGIIIGVDVTNVGSDSGPLRPMVEPIKERSGHKPQAMLVDGGFTTLDDIERVEQDGIQVNGPIKDEEKQKAQGIDPYQPGKKDGPGVSHWRARMGTPEAKIIYRLRAQTVEWANAGARNRGLYQVTVRGVQQVLAVVLLHALAHNLLRAVALRREKGFPEAAR